MTTNNAALRGIEKKLRTGEETINAQKSQGPPVDDRRGGATSGRSASGRRTPQRSTPRPHHQTAAGRDGSKSSKT